MPVTSASGLFYLLSDYLTQTRQLLRDSTGALYTDPDLTYFINTALRQRDLDLGFNRVRYSFTLVSGTYSYSFAAIVAGGTVLSGNANAILQDVFSLIVMPLGGATSSIRYPLGRWPYSKLAYLLSTAYPTYPAFYAMYGPSTIMLGPPPNGAYPCEIDCIGYSADLVNPSDQDQMPYPATDLIPYQAAALAKTQAQRFDEAEKFDQVYQRRLMRVRARMHPLSVPNPWSDLPRGR